MAMTDKLEFAIRPAKPGRADMKDAFRVYLSGATLLNLKLRAGDPCQLELPGPIFKTAIAWTAPENIGKTVLQASDILQQTYDLKPKDRVYISRETQELKPVVTAYLRECTETSVLADYGRLPESDLSHWAWFLAHPLSRAEFLTPGLVFRNVDAKGQKRSFVVEELDRGGDISAQTLFRFTAESKVEIRTAEAKTAAEPVAGPLQLATTLLGGLRSQIAQINECLEEFGPRAQDFQLPSWDRPSHGMLIFGPKGTGKSLLLAQLGTASWRKVFTVDSFITSGGRGEPEKALRKVFADALRLQPSLVTIDEIDRLTPRQGSQEAINLAPIIREGLDSISKQDARVLVVATARHPSDVDETLRTSHRLETEIELAIPSAAQRLEILKAIRGTSSQPSDAILDQIADRTHGYVGADLHGLLRLASRKARFRQRQADILRNTAVDSSEAVIVSSEEPSERVAVPYDIELSDVALALEGSRPTAMREVFLETPKVRWSDIGGQHAIKAQLQEAVELPLKYPGELNRLNIQPTKGILLYGPAGCSKTMTVKALATEAGLNFLAVKGAEMVSMYVGESERAVREIFRKARAASPSIIFFDEIDAIASSRSDRGSQGGLNVLTTLLNEMDGIEELKNVLVVAATNKPGSIDPALMRPGRLDFLLYVGPPDLESRREILKIWIKKSDVSTDVDLDMIAASTEGYSGAEIISICGKAGRAAYREGRDLGTEVQITQSHFDNALQQVKKQITASVISQYESWARNFGG